MRRLLYLFPVLMALLPVGCKQAPAIPEPQQSAASKAQMQAMADAESALGQVPPPSKTRYQAVHSLDQWENPYLTVQASVITLHVLVADANPSTIGQGSMLRPVGARRQDMTIRQGDLVTALSAIPPEAWPYGRVIAVEEQRGAAQAERPAIRRNVEGALKTLNDLGLVVVESNDQIGGVN